MSKAVQQFMALIQAATVERCERPALSSRKTLMVFCESCHEQTPHEHTPDGWQCVFVFSHPLSERGHISREFAKILNWLVVIVLILFVVLKDVPW